MRAAKRRGTAAFRPLLEASVMHRWDSDGGCCSLGNGTEDLCLTQPAYTCTVAGRTSLDHGLPPHAFPAVVLTAKSMISHHWPSPKIGQAWSLLADPPQGSSLSKTLLGVGSRVQKML